MEEPPGPLGDDTAPNLSEASLAALGSCIGGVHANAVPRGIMVRKPELQLQADINTTAVSGTGHISPKPVRFGAAHVKVEHEADTPREELDALVAHAKTWSPVASTFTKPVPVSVST